MSKVFESVMLYLFNFFGVR